MTRSGQDRNWIASISSRGAIAGLATLMVLVLTVIVARSAPAQTFTVLHNFTGGTDGGSPSAGITMDRAGNLYGTTYNGGTGQGAVFKLVHKGSNWVFSPLYSFAGGSDGAGPVARVVFGPNGTLYGTASFGGPYGYGVVYEIIP
jgi:uncharacterized repeat protein (TIGR03803 family)